MQTIKFNKLNLKEDDLLLDMGCGEGRHTIGAYIEKPVNSFGFDLSFKDLKIARDRLNDFDVSYKKETPTSHICNSKKNHGNKRPLH